MKKQINFMASMQYPIFMITILSVSLEVINEKMFPYGVLTGCLIALGMAYYWTAVRFILTAKERQIGS